MDLKMNAEDISNKGTFWDCKVTNGIVPIITNDDEDLQTATIASFLIKGTIPQLTDIGVSWTDFLINKISFGELDTQIRESLQNVEKGNYYPNYKIEEDQLTMTVGKLEEDE